MIETGISKAIIEAYTEKLIGSLESDVLIAGAGPAGLTAAFYLAKIGINTVVIEKRISIGGGIWGGAAGYNLVAFEDRQVLDDFGITTRKKGKLLVADSIEFATALAYHANKAGAKIFNLMEAEDIVLKNKSVKGLVVNNPTIRGAGLLVDPFCISSKFIIDATGHPAEILNMLKKKMSSFHPQELSEGFMDVERSEKQVVEKTGEVYPGIYVSGMSVCTAYNIPRMGPIFGGMLKSGKRVSDIIIKKLGNRRNKK